MHETAVRAPRRDTIAEVVAEVLVDVAREAGKPRPIVLETSDLTSEIGLSSLDLADVAVQLEARLGLREFPVLDWWMTESRRTDDGAFTVASLVDACVKLVESNDTPTSRSIGEPRGSWSAVVVAVAVVVLVIVAAALLSSE